MIAFLESSEFWTSFAFVLVVVVACSPVIKGLKKWGQKQADIITSSEKEAEQLFQKAKALRDSYEKAYQQRGQERKKAMQEVEQKITFLEQEIQTKTEEKIHHKKLEVALRIQNIQENEQQILKTKLMTRVIGQVKEDLLQKPPVEKTDDLADSVCQALDQFKTALN